MNNSTVPTPIIDKNGKRTTVYRKSEFDLANNDARLRAFDRLAELNRASWTVGRESRNLLDTHMEAKNVFASYFGDLGQQINNNSLTQIKELRDESNKVYNSVVRTELAVRLAALDIDSIDYQVEVDANGYDYGIKVTAVNGSDDVAAFSDAVGIFQDHAYEFIVSEPEVHETVINFGMSFEGTFTPAGEDIYISDNEVLRDNYPDVIMDSPAIEQLNYHARKAAEWIAFENMNMEFEKIRPDVAGIDFSVRYLDDDFGYTTVLENLVDKNGRLVDWDDVDDDDEEDIRAIFNEWHSDFTTDEPGVHRFISKL